MSRTDAKGLTLVGASAGSGKTHRLTREVTEAVDPTRANAIGPEALVAVTYTRRAATELGARIRRSLVTNGAYERAQRLPLARLGTVHAVCLRLLQELALDAGLSPHVDVLAGSEARLLREALEWGLPPELREQLEKLAVRLELRVQHQVQRTDWITPVQDIMSLARSNRIPPAALPAMATRSAKGLLALLGPPEMDGEALDAELLAALKRAERDLKKVDDGQKNTAGARDTITAALEKAKAGELLWSDWVKLQKLAPGKAARGLVEPLSAIAARVERHPRLHADVREVCRLIYEAARLGLDAYDDWKKKRRVVDYVDMVDRALTLVDRPEVASELAQRLRLVVVDEFQDTSPLQLALFAKLHPIARRSTWVGDRKQCIFEFAGADPALMEAVTRWVSDSGGSSEQLPGNWRSRPELVRATSRLFAAAFARHGYAPEEVEVRAERKVPAGLEGLPPLGLWSMSSANVTQDSEALAEGVRRLLADPSATPVVDRVSNEVRPIRAGDLCVLVSKNSEVEALATALARRGVRASVARTGLLATPEGTLLEAALCALIDSHDTHARAIISSLTGFDGKSPDAWLSGLVTAQASWRAARDEGEKSAQSPRAPASPQIARLDALRAEVVSLAPSEAVERIFSELDMPALVVRWPDPEQRLANLDALRALSLEYEQRCAQQREAGTIAGLLRFFDEAAEVVLVRDEERASDEQHVGGGDNAVTVATYHRAKGLEWPVVILASLDRPERRTPFEVSPETDRMTFDAADPLGQRWIRYWPSPFGGQKATHLAEVAAASKEGLDVAAREERERVRLLYVGLTRARDHLILAARVNAKGAYSVKWLHELCDGGGKPLLELPTEAAANERGVIGIRGLDGKSVKVATRHWAVSTGGDAPVKLPIVDNHTWFAPAEELVTPGYWISPSHLDDAAMDLPVPRVAEAETIGERLPLGASKGVTWDVVGDAVHAFLACDLPTLTEAQRLESARRLLGASELLGLLAPEALLKTSDQLRAWVERTWPGAIWHRELPVTAALATPHGTRRIQGTIDLLLETADGVVVIDHKSYPGAASTWRDKAGEFAPQLGAYSHVLRAAGKTVLGCWVSFAIGGGVVKLDM